MRRNYNMINMRLSIVRKLEEKEEEE